MEFQDIPFVYAQPVPYRRGDCNLVVLSDLYPFYCLLLDLDLVIYKPFLVIHYVGAHSAFSL